MKSSCFNNQPQSFFAVPDDTVCTNRGQMKLAESKSDKEILLFKFEFYKVFSNYFKFVRTYSYQTA